MKKRWNVVLTVTMVASGCQAWHPVARPTADGPLPGDPQTVKVTRTSNCGEKPTLQCAATRGTVVLHNPRIAGDSLIGYYDVANRERVAMHVRDVVSIESRGVDPLRTTGAALGVGAIIVAGGIVVLLLLLAGSY